MSVSTLTDSASTTTQILDAEIDPAVALVEKIFAEGPIGMQAAARLVGSMRAGAKTHSSTITRWCRNGVTLPDGRKLKLEHIYTTGKLTTSRQAIVRFIAAQQPQCEACDPTSIPRSPAARDRATVKAGEFLDSIGVK